MRLFAYCLILMAALGVNAAEIRLATAISDTLSDVTVFYLETDANGEALAMRYVTTEESGRISEDVHSRVDEIIGDGVGVKSMEGREIIRLFLEKFDAQAGGDVRLRYLANGVTGSFGSRYLRLMKIKGQFALADDKGSVVNTLFIKGNWSRILRRWIGVSSINASFEAKNI